MKNQKKDLPEEPFDPDTESSFEIDELNFSEEEEQFFANLPSKTELDESEIPNSENLEAIDTSDDFDPEILIKEDGARSPKESSADIPADEELTILDINQIGAGCGLDEAELAQIKPLDGKPEF